MDNSPKGKIAQCRESSSSRHNYYAEFTKALDDPIKNLLQEHSMAAARSRKLPAVDLAAGSAYFTSQLALRYREPFCDHGSLEWYPTDTHDALQNFTRPCLEYLANEAAEQESLLCRDRNGDALFPREQVELQGLKTTAYNGLGGVVLHTDPNIAGCYAVQLDKRTKPSSFKPEKFVRTATPTTVDAADVVDNDNSTTIEEKQRRILSSRNYLERYLYNGLLERSCSVDLLKRETWSALTLKLKRQCGLVTCTNLLTEIGHREPTVWKNVMEVGSELLVSGGFLLQGDANGWGHFGNVRIMEEHAKSLGLTIHTQVQLEAWALVLWKKL